MTTKPVNGLINLLLRSAIYSIVDAVARFHRTALIPTSRRMSSAECSAAATRATVAIEEAA